MTDAYDRKNNPPLRCIECTVEGGFVVEGSYTIWLGKESVGQATVERQGLYYRFRCCCQLHSEVICRVNVSCGGRSESLGILIPAGSDYRLTKKIPIKQFELGTPEFWITPRHTEKQGIFLDIYPEEPFHYLTKLEKAYLDKRRGRAGIVIPCCTPDPAEQGSGHCRECQDG